MILKTTLFASSLVLAALYGHDEEAVKKHHEMIVKTMHGDHHPHLVLKKKDDGPLTLHYGGEELSLDVDSLADGASKTLQTKDGDLTVTRDGDELNIEGPGGKEFRVPLVHEEGMMAFSTGKGHSMVFAGKGSGHQPAETVTILGLSDLDEASQEKIREAIRAAGVEKPVSFSEHSFSWVSAGSEDGEDSDTQVFVEEAPAGDKKMKIIIKKKDDIHEETTEEDKNP